MELREVAFRYAIRGSYILREINVGLSPGQLIEVTGRNGVGKSTLLKLLAGGIIPSRGTIRSRPKPVGYAPEHFPAYQPFTMSQYLTRMQELQGFSPDRSSIDQWASRMGCRSLLNVRLADLSLGSSQKVGLIQALIPRPALLVLDEPFAALDDPARHELMKILIEIRMSGGIVVVSDHQNNLRPFSDCTIWHIDRGTVTTSVKEEPCHGGPISEAGDATILEVLTVNQQEAGLLAAKLRAEGYCVRLHEASYGAGELGQYE